MAYATEAEYEDETGTTAPANINRLLTLASRDVDAALIAAVYDVEDGAATDAAVIVALKEATIEQVAYHLDSGDETGTGGSQTYADVQIGSVRLGRPQTGGAVGGSAGRPLAPQAFAVLQLAGLTNHEPYTYPVCAAADG
jgi:hypothetical protein